MASWERLGGAWGRLGRVWETPGKCLVASLGCFFQSLSRLWSVLLENLIFDRCMVRNHYFGACREPPKQSWKPLRDILETSWKLLVSLGSVLDKKKADSRSGDLDLMRKYIFYNYFWYQFGSLFWSKNCDFDKDILQKSHWRHMWIYDEIWTRRDMLLGGVRSQGNLKLQPKSSQKFSKNLFQNHVFFRVVFESLFS